MAKLDDALRIFERILSLQPTHIIALMGKVSPAFGSGLWLHPNQSDLSPSVVLGPYTIRSSAVSTGAQDIPERPEHGTKYPTRPSDWDRSVFLESR